ncbi:Mannose-1-phosphate guanylyltransferase / Mannose-6-phosphate isomerase [hydrothermal vent metagenome]|uniref:mannose-1-phosphate guanylyltransferase n=1 Tax=hydrothermal vent metagenome TaxID=652676 RepID=A0A3B0Z6I3_9ZZZZ
MDLQPVILSGGSGTRLWPLSREHYPKQLLPLHGDDTMLQDTVLRLDGFSFSEDVIVNPPLVICNEEHRFLVAEQVRQLGRDYKKILLEPVGRNTAPALTLAALSIVTDHGDGMMLVMPADHVIQDKASFHSAVQQGFKSASQGTLVTFGIVPTAPETGYGYIKKGELQPIQGIENAFSLAAFVEKPDVERAKAYLASGEYLWNSGMFMMKATTWLAAIERFKPEIAQACRTAYEKGASDSDFYRVDTEAFQHCPSDSIDYAVMEHVTESRVDDLSAVVIPLDAGWSDVGAWPALWEIGEKDECGNVIKGDVYAFNTKNTLALSESRLVAMVGLEDTIVIETADAVLVAHKDRIQDIKLVVKRLKEEGRTQHQMHQQVCRPWGTYEGIDLGERFQVKRITVNPGASLSLQMHYHRAEHWIVVSGTAKVTKGDEEILLTENQSTYIPLGVTHRLENPGKVLLELIEVQSGSYLGEDDIVRFEDVYGR